MTTDTQTLGDRLRRLREERGWTQEDLAKRSGLNRVTVTRLEIGTRGGRRINWGTVCAIAHAAQVPPESLMEGVVLGAEREPRRRKPKPPPFGANLRREREKAGLTLDALAAATGIDRSAIHKYEQDKAIPGGRAIAALVRALGIPVAVLFENPEDKEYSPWRGRL